MGSKIASVAACLLAASAPVPALSFAPSFPSPPRAIAAARTSSFSFSSALTKASEAQHAPEDTHPQRIDNASAAHDARSNPVGLPVAALCAIAVTTTLQPAAAMDASAGGVVPFTVQEMWWAIRDGYVGDLMSHLFRNGGLVMSDTAGIVGTSLSPQELGEAMFSNGVGGGVSIPFRPEEVLFAIQHGYSYDMVAHWFRYSGLVV